MYKSSGNVPGEVLRFWLPTELMELVLSVVRRRSSMLA